MKRFVFLIMLLYATVGAACADVDSITLKADYLRFDQVQTYLQASGNVEVFSPSFSMKSDTLEVDTSRNIFIFNNRVDGLLDGNAFSADRYTVYGDDEQMEARNISAKVRTKEVGGVVSFKAASLFKKGEEQWGGDGVFTTCKYGTPHFHIQSSAYHYYPDDRAEAQNMLFWIGPLPLLYSPYWIYKLGYQNPIMYYPVIGQDETSGWFLQTTWDYYWNKSHNSLFLVDWYERIGYGLGVDHSWKIDTNSDLRAKVFGLFDTQGVLDDEYKYYTDIKYNLALSKELNTNWSYYYQTYDRYTNNYSKKEQKTFASTLRYARGSDNINFSYNHSYDYRYMSIYRNKYNLSLNNALSYLEDNYEDASVHNIDRRYGYSTMLLEGSLRSDYSTQQTNDRLRSSTLTEHYDRMFSLGNTPLNAVRFSFDPQWLQRRSDVHQPFDQSLVHNYNADFSPAPYTPLTNLNVRYYWIDDLDSSQVNTDYTDMYQVKSLPEVKMGFKPVPVNIPLPGVPSGNELNLFTLQQNNFLYGHYIETKKLANSDYKMDASKYSMSTSLVRNQRIDEINANVNFSSRFEQIFYDTGDQANTRDDNYGVSVDWFGFMRYSLNYGRNYPGTDLTDSTQKSGTPFFFDAKNYSLYNNRNQVFSLYLMSPQEELVSRYVDLPPLHQPWQMFLWNFSWSHNFITNYFTDISTDLTLQPIEALRINLSAVFDPYDRNSNGYFWTQPLTGVTDWRITNELYLRQNFRIDLNLPQDTNLLNASNELGYVQQIGEAEYLKFKLTHLWDNYRKQWYTNNYSVAWEQDCIMYMYDYSRMNEEHKFTFKIKAFEADPLGYSKSRINGVDKWQFQGLNKSMERR